MAYSYFIRWKSVARDDDAPFYPIPFPFTDPTLVRVKWGVDEDWQNFTNLVLDTDYSITKITDGGELRLLIDPNSLVDEARPFAYLIIESIYPYLNSNDYPINYSSGITGAINDNNIILIQQLQSKLETIWDIPGLTTPGGAISAPNERGRMIKINNDNGKNIFKGTSITEQDGGDGVHVHVNLWAEGRLDVAGNASIVGTFTCGGHGTFQGNLTVHGNLTLHSDLVVPGDIECTNLAATGTVEAVNGDFTDVAISNNLSISGSMTVTGPLTIAADITVSGIHTFIGLDTTATFKALLVQSITAHPNEPLLIKSDTTFEKNVTVDGEIATPLVKTDAMTAFQGNEIGVDVKLNSTADFETITNIKGGVGDFISYRWLQDDGVGGTTPKLFRFLLPTDATAGAHMVLQASTSPGDYDFTVSTEDVHSINVSENYYPIADANGDLVTGNLHKTLTHTRLDDNLVVEGTLKVDSNGGGTIELVAPTTDVTVRLAVDPDVLLETRDISLDVTGVVTQAGVLELNVGPRVTGGGGGGVIYIEPHADIRPLLFQGHLHNQQLVTLENMPVGTLDPVTALKSDFRDTSFERVEAKKSAELVTYATSGSLSTGARNVFSVDYASDLTIDIDWQTNPENTAQTLTIVLYPNADALTITWPNGIYWNETPPDQLSGDLPVVVSLTNFYVKRHKDYASIVYGDVLHSNLDTRTLELAYYAPWLADSTILAMGNTGYALYSDTTGFALDGGELNGADVDISDSLYEDFEVNNLTIVDGVLTIPASFDQQTFVFEHTEDVTSIDLTAVNTEHAYNINLIRKPGISTQESISLPGDVYREPGKDHIILGTNNCISSFLFCGGTFFFLGSVRAG